MVTEIFLIAILLLFAFFFAAMEVAFVSSNKLRIELDKKRDRHFSNIIELYMNNPAQYYSTMVIGNIIIITLIATLLSQVGADFFQSITTNFAWLLVLDILSACLLFLLFSEVLPKLTFKSDSNNLLKVIAIPAAVFYYLFYVLSRTVFRLSALVSRAFTKNTHTKDEPIFWGAVDWDTLSEQQMNEVEKDDESNDVKMFKNALDFSNVKLRECMIPRPEIIAVSIDDTIENLKKMFINSGLSKIIIYKGSLDNVVGYAPSISIFQKPANIAVITRDMPIVPETMSANKLLSLFIQNHRSIALVVDEFGGTSGVVTIEDILEEIVGDIQDEHDKKRYREHRFTENHFQFSARLEIDYINEKYDLDLPDSEEYETLAGFILAHYGAIPKVQDVVVFDKYKFTILRASATKIELVDLVVSG